ncbi:MAG: transglycosylase SLT domain-containing protein [Candidatus Sulfobium sp.]|jgi:soluble lytic murein transglycosylase-like protein
MVRGMMKGHTIIEYKWIFLAKVVVLGLIIVSGLGLTYVVTVPGMPASASKAVPKVMPVPKPAPAHRSAAELRSAAIKSAVLEWMRAKSDMPDETLSRIYDAALKSGNADLILAVCVVESSFNPTARSDKGAIGLMGIMPKVWLNELKEKGIVSERRDLYKIPKNIASGAYVLERYVGRTGDIEAALTGYVGGDPSYAQKVLHELGEIYLVRWSVLGSKVS